MRTFTLRGRVAANTKKDLIVDDGRFNHGMIVKEFYAWGVTQGTDIEVALCLREDNVGSNWDASNSNQIAWAAQVGTAGTRLFNFNLIDPDHVVVRDLILNNFSSDVANYLVILESRSLSDDQAILALIKERGQDDL